MKEMLHKLFIENFQKKFFSFVAALIIWVVANDTITTTRVFTNIAIRVVNIPSGKTIRGLLPSGLLDRKITVTLTGARDPLDDLSEGDFEIVIDASGREDEWAVDLGRKNLVSLNPDIDLIHSVRHVAHGQLILKISKLVTEKIPVYIEQPKGEAPKGYQFLDIWPQRVTHIISGPEEDIKSLKADGLRLVFDLGEITESDLDALSRADMAHTDEVSYIVPDSWKQVPIPFLNNLKQEINGPDAINIRVDFLRRDLLPIDRPIPLRIFYPLEYAATINPKTAPLKAPDWVRDVHGVSCIQLPLFAIDVSRQFLDVVRDRLEVTIIAAPSDNGASSLNWEVDLVDVHRLEAEYVTMMQKSSENDPDIHLRQKPGSLQYRFQQYKEKIRLFVKKNTRFDFQAHLKDGQIVLTKKEVFGNE